MNLAASAVELRDYPRRGPPPGAPASSTAADRDLDAWFLYLSGWLARSQFEQGRWDAAAATAADLLARSARLAAEPDHGADGARAGCAPAAAIPTRGRRSTRRSSSRTGTGEVQRLGPVAAARAEAHWLAGAPDADTVDGETATALHLSLESGETWMAGELYVWRRRCGIDEEPSPDSVAAPYRLELGGAGEAAAHLWQAIGCPYEAALAMAETNADDARRRALAELQRMGARPAASRVARALREGGARDVRRGPRTATRENPGGLTARQVEVLALVGEGLRNSEIAARLFVSERTAAHHVSAILRKLDVATRGQAAAEAVRLGIVVR